MESKDKNSKETKSPIMHSFKGGKSSLSQKKVLVIFIALFLFGAGTGYGLSTYSSQTGNNVPILPKNNGATTGKIFGSDDTKTFKDVAEGKLEEGGIEGEGQYHLVRSEDESQHVYVTSSTVDLSKFIGKNIKVWGQTQTAQTAGWLMDVGRVEVK
ncbi:MAG TPA: hypothetical protein VNA13_02155 [Xanthomonadales bacterium]|nr:hypothetical protein [Xanthomonadales bacterium]